jgi:hypothetical protein
MITAATYHMVLNDSIPGMLAGAADEGITAANAVFATACSLLAGIAVNSGITPTEYLDHFDWPEELKALFRDTFSKVDATMVLRA